MAQLEVQEFDFVRKVLRTSDQRLLPIAHLFDALGRETADHRQAVVCIAGQRGGWLTVRLADYSKASLQ